MSGCVLMLGLLALKQGGIFIVPQQVWHGASVFRSYQEDLPNAVALIDIDTLVLQIFSITRISTSRGISA